MKKLLFMVGLLWSAIASAQFTPGQLLTAAELNSQFALYAPLAGATFTGPVTIPTLTVSTTFSMPASTVLPNGVTATTQGFSDNSTSVATDNFTKRSILAASATIPISGVTGGTYNFATIGSGAQIVVLASGGSITGVLTIAAAGSGYQVGDCIVMVGGNADAILRVTSLSGSGVATASVVYGGTGYTTGSQLTGMTLPPGSRTGAITGTLSSPLTIIIPAGTYLQGGRRIGFQNNTTGAFTTTVFLSNGAGGSTGTGTVLPQGTANSSSTILYTDGQNDVWAEVTPLAIGALSSSSGAVPLTSLATQAPNTIVANATGSTASPTAIAVPSCSTTSSALNWTSGTGLSCNTTVNASTLGGATFAAPGSVGSTTPGTGSFTTLAASSTVGGTGFSTYLASPPAIGGTVAAAGAFTTLSASGNDALFYQDNNAQSIPNNTATTVTTWTKISDRVNANFNAATGVFTAPVTGQYWASANLTYAVTTGGSGIVQDVRIVGNGVTLCHNQLAVGVTTTVPESVSTSCLVSLTAGQTIIIQAFQNSGSAVVLAVGSAFNNTVSIARLP